MLKPNRTFVEWCRARPSTNNNNSINKSHKILSSFYNRLYEEKTQIQSKGKSKLIDFQPPWYLRSPDIQSLLCVTRPTSRFVYERYQRELVNFSDGGTGSMDWFEPPTLTKKEPTEQQENLSNTTTISTTTEKDSIPIVFILHGLTGGSHEGYVTHFIECLVSRLHCRCVVINNRGCADTPLTSPKLFNAATVDDVEHCINIIKSRYPQSPLCGIGFSLGSIILVSLLTEISSNPEKLERYNIAGAVSVSNPFDMRQSCLRLIREPFLNWTYNRTLTNNLKNLALKHKDILQIEKESLQKLKKIKSVYEFDDIFTAPSINLSSADEYYNLASSSRKLDKVKTPLLMLNAIDDPIVDPKGIPFDQFRKSDYVMFLGSYQGGHLGFFDSLPKASNSPSWAERTCSMFFECVLTNISQKE